MTAEPRGVRGREPVPGTAAVAAAGPPAPRLLWVAAAFLLGLVAGELWRPVLPVAVGWGGAGVLCLTGAWIRHRRLPDPGEAELLPRLGPLTVALLLAGAAAISLFNMSIRILVLEGSELTDLDGRVVAVEGRVATDPAEMERGWSYFVRSIRVLPDAYAPEPKADPPEDPIAGSREVTGRLFVRTYGEEPGVQIGDRIRLEVRISGLDPAKPFEARLARRNVVGIASAVSVPQVVAPTGNLLLRSSNFFRSRIMGSVAQVLPGDRGGTVLGLVIGDESMVGDRVREDFRAAGLSHLTAVSGSNLAMVLGALGVFLLVLRVPRRAVVLLGLPAIVIFSTITRWEPSVLRAAIMACVALLAFLMGRLPSTAHAFALALIGLLAFDPMMLWSVGFQLSFAATAGILWLRPVLLARLAHLPRPVAEALAIGVGAQVAVFPLIALHFGRISVAAVPANLLATGLVAPITILGLLGGVAAMVSADLATPFMQVAGWLAGLLQWIARTFGRPESAEIRVPYFGAAETVGSYLVILGAWLALARRGMWARWPAVLGALLLVVASLAPLLAVSSPAGLRVTIFDVGSGDAALVESRGGVRILFDGGRDPDAMAARLKRRGVKRIDLVVASHMHADHVAGLQGVLRRLEVALAVHPGVRAPMLFLLAAEQPMEVVTSGDVVKVGDLTLEILGPSLDLRELAGLSVSDQSGPEGPGLNDASVVMRVEWGGECVLFTGDLEEAGQAEVMGKHPQRIGCAVLQAPHHGSGRLLPEFVQAVDPHWITISVGPNPYGHPSSKALAIYEQTGARILRTDRDGDLILEIDDDGQVRLGR